MQEARSQLSDPPTSTVSRQNLTRNFGILLVGEVISKVIGIFVFGRLGVVLGESVYGELEFVFAAITLSALLADAGLVVYGARAVARDGTTPSTLVPAFLVLRGALAVASLVIMGVLALTGTGASPAILLAACLVILPLPLVSDWVFQGRDEMSIVTASNILRQSCLLVGVLLFVDTPEHAWRVPIADGVGLALVAAWHQILVRRRAPSLRWHGVVGRAITVAKEALPLGLSTVAWAARFWAPMVFVGVSTDGVFKGHYGAAHRLTVAMHQVVFLYYYNLLPTWSRLATETQGALSSSLRAAVRKSSLISLGLACSMILATWWLSHDVIRVLGYGERFQRSAELLNVLCFVPAIAWVSGNVRFGLIAAGHPRGDMWANAAGAFTLIATLALCSSSISTTVVPAFVAAEAITGIVAFAWWRTKVRRGAVT